MPELPEVETVRRGLEPALAGRRLIRVEARRPDLRFPLPDRFIERITGAQVLGLTRRAKYLLAALDTGETLVCHLGMSGRFTIVRAQSADGDRLGAPLVPLYYSNPPNPTHTHIAFETDAGDRIEYNDPRRFGYMALAETVTIDHHLYFKDLGPEPLGNAFNARHLAQAFAGRSQNVKATLLDQRIVAGLGNIYVCEALHRAGIAPSRAAGAISKARLEALAREIRAVLMEAIAAGGSSLRDFAQANGALGYFQHGFRVYDREGEACAKAQCRGVVERFAQNGRSTFHCPRCQR